MKPFHTVKLRFFQDDATGDFGLAHEETFSDNNAFNAFWDGQGIFHDVFEHWFEKEHKYFRGDYAMNIGGEMAAMGAMWYYYNQLGIYNRPLGGRDYMDVQAMIRTTSGMVQEAIEYGNCNFGSTLESNVPKQKSIPNWGFEDGLADYWFQVKEMKTACSGYDDNDKERARDYRKSVKRSKIQNLHRWGYRMAKKLVPDTQENCETLVEFINYWNRFCGMNSAQELANVFRRIEIRLYKTRKGIKWDAVLISNDSQVEDVELKATFCPDVESILIEAYQEEEQEEENY